MTTLTEALAPKTDQLTADELISGPRNITFSGVRIAKDGRSTRIILSYEGDGGKPFKPCKTMGRAMVMVWGIVEGREDDFIGKTVTVYRDPEVTFGDQGQIGGVRISHMSHISKPTTVKLTVSQGSKRAFVFQPLQLSAAHQKKQTPQEWTANYIEGLSAVSTQDAYDLAIKGSRSAMSRLATDYPELHKQAVAAEAEAEKRCIAAQQASVDDDPFGAGISANTEGGDEEVGRINVKTDAN